MDTHTKLDTKIYSARVRASIKYNASHCKKITMYLNLRTDADIIDRLEEVKNKQGYIKRLIREDLEKIQ